jgi:glycosyltransferase involved in cell wall biosynthesis
MTTANLPEGKHLVFQIIASLVPAGAERLVVHLLEYIDRERFAPVCICLRNPVGSHLEARVQQLGIPLYFLGKGDKMSLKVLRKLDALFRQYRPVVVHTHLLALNYAYPLMIRYRTPARVHTVHSLAQREMGVRVGAWVRMMAFRYHIGGVVPVAVADEVRASIQQLYGYPDPPLIPNGIPTDEYAPNPDTRAQWRQAHGIEPHATVLTHVGRFAPPKNHALLIEAFAQVRADAPLYLLLVGGGELENAVREQVAGLGLQGRVRFLGVRADVADILRASDVFVLSSRWEGNPMSVMEAMAAGLPVVSTAVGGVPELVQHGATGLLVPAGDACSLAEAIAQLGCDPARRAAIGNAARQTARERFDVRVMSLAYATLYQQLLCSSTSGSARGSCSRLPKADRREVQQRLRHLPQHNAQVLLGNRLHAELLQPLCRRRSHLTQQRPHNRPRHRLHIIHRH